MTRCYINKYVCTYLLIILGRHNSRHTCRHSRYSAKVVDSISCSCWFLKIISHLTQPIMQYKYYSHVPDEKPQTQSNLQPMWASVSKSWSVFLTSDLQSNHTMTILSLIYRSIIFIWQFDYVNRHCPYYVLSHSITCDLISTRIYLIKHEKHSFIYHRSWFSPLRRNEFY